MQPRSKFCCQTLVFFYGLWWFLPLSIYLNKYSYSWIIKFYVFIFMGTDDFTYSYSRVNLFIIFIFNSWYSWSALAGPLPRWRNTVYCKCCYVTSWKLNRACDGALDSLGSPVSNALSVACYAQISSGTRVTILDHTVFFFIKSSTIWMHRSVCMFLDLGSEYLNGCWVNKK